MEHVRDKGWIAAPVERWNSFAGPPMPIERDPAFRLAEALHRQKGWGDNMNYVLDFVREYFPPPHVGLRQDLFGFADILAFTPKRKEVVLIQATSQSNVSNHLAKIRAIPEAKAWVQSGNVLIIHGWSQEAKGKKWNVSSRRLRLEDFETK